MIKSKYDVPNPSFGRRAPSWILFIGSSFDIRNLGFGIACLDPPKISLPTEQRDMSLPLDAPVDPALIAAHRQSDEVQLIELDGDAVIARHAAAGVDPVNHTLTLQAGLGTVCWAIYRFSDMLASDTIKQAYLGV